MSWTLDGASHTSYSLAEGTGHSATRGVLFVLFLSILLGSAGFFAGQYQAQKNVVFVGQTARAVPQPVAATPQPVQAAVAPAAQNFIDIQPVLDAWGKSHPKQQWGVVVKSLDGPSFAASYQADRQFELASIYKLYLVVPLFQKVPLEKQSTTYVTVAGKKVSIADCLDRMIRNSDNACGEAIGSYVGWTKSTKLLKQMGFTHTSIVRNTGGILVSTPSDTVQLLEQLHGSLLPAAAREKVLSIMSQQRYRLGVPAGCPDCQVADKVGWLATATNDAAIVKYSGGTYVLSIYSNNNSNFPAIADLTRQIHAAILAGQK